MEEPPPPPRLAWPEGARLEVTETTVNSASLRWPQAAGPVTNYRLTANGETRDVASTDAVLNSLTLGSHVAVSVVAVDAAGNSTPPLRAEAAAAEKLVVPDGDVSTDFCGANAFLIRGVPIPCGSFSVVTGHVRTRDGVGVPGLRVTVLNHPEFGEAVSQADGLFAMALTAGRHTIELRASSFIPLQRQVGARAGTFVVMADTVVLRRDEKATTITPSVGGFHLATTQQDADGTRTTAVFIPPGTDAFLKLRDGGMQPSAQLTLRATEATVGATGPEQMPGELPGATAYTFAADVSADEALAINAAGVGFSNQVAVYADNFLKHPIGTAIPLGLYDETTGRWESGPNAAVLQITEGGGVDYTGDGVADADFPLLAGEQAVLAANFAAGTQLVRSLTTHFSTFDTNPCWVCDGSCEENGESSAGDVPECTTCPGSVLRMENQTLSEFAPVSGTSLQLGWHSNRFNVREASVDMALGLLADGGQPVGVKATYFRVSVAGRKLEIERLDGGVGDTARISWDHKDVFGRTVRGSMPATATMGYGFGARYVATRGGGVIEYTAASFGVGPPRGAVQLSSTRDTAFILKHRNHSIGDWVPRENLGNLTLDIVHGYSEDGTLHLGTGAIVTAPESAALIRYVAGGGTDTSEDGGAAAVSLADAPTLADGPQGIFFIENGRRVRLLRTDGGVITVAGSTSTGFEGDGLPATQGRFNNAKAMAIDPAGNLYIADEGNRRIRRIDAATGIISTVVGDGQTGVSPDGTLGTETHLEPPLSLHWSRDGHLYFMSDEGTAGETLRRLENGRVVTVAGGSPSIGAAWEAPAREVHFRRGAHWIAEDPEGRMLIAGYDTGGSNSAYVVRRIELDGRVKLIAGAGGSPEPYQHIPTRTPLAGLTGLAVGEDGTIYIGEAGWIGGAIRGPGVRAVMPDGLFSLFLGGVAAGPINPRPPDGAVAATQVYGVGELKLGRNGRLLVVLDGSRRTLHEIVLPGLNGQRLVPSRDGNEVYAFDPSGRHLRTVSARTGVTLWEFTWGQHGLNAIKDVDGDVTEVVRDGDGRATALVAADGQHTELTFDDVGRVTRITDSEGRFVEAAYKPGTGLLEEWKDANGHPTRFEWDRWGALTAHINAVGAKKTWGREGKDVVTLSGENRKTTYKKDWAGSSVLLTTALADGTESYRQYASGVQRMTAADGTVTVVTMQPSAAARFARPVDVPGEVSVKTPGGLEFKSTSSRKTTGVVGEVFGISEEVEETRVNGQLWRTRYDGVAKTLALTSPVGRTSSVTLDEKRRPVTMTAPGVLPVTWTRDARGRVTTVTQGARTLTYAWNTDGYLASVTNALNETVSFTSDSTGRVSKVTQTDGKDVLLSQDAVGNLTSVTPADRQAHGFTYSRVNEVTSYAPPSLSGVSAETTTYDLDGLAKTAGHSDGSSTSVTRDAAGRAMQVTTPWWTNVSTYDATTGQPKSLTRGTQSLEWTFDGFLQREEKATGVAPATSQWAYDTDFRVTGHTVGGTTIPYAYDADSLLTQAGAGALTYDTTTGQLRTLTIGNVVTTWTWNDFGELATVSTAVSGSPVFSEGIQYDAAGRITVIEETVQGTPAQWAYGNDAMGRLTSAAKNGGAATTWTYDGNGNRLSESGVPSTYDAQDRLLTRGSTTYTWDALGGRRSKTEGSAVTEYVHDGLGALQSVKLPSGTTISYDYDGRQRRVARRKNGIVDKRWIYDGQYRVVAEVDASGAVTSRFVYGSQSNSPDYFVRAGVTYAFAKNHLGSVRLVVNTSNGSVAQSLEYDAWGNVTADSSPGFQPFAFAGGVFDVDTALTHFGFRDYDALGGVWTSRDPMRLASGLGQFSYCGAAPTTYIDHTGLWSPSAHDQILSRVFQGKLSKADIERLQASSRDFDKRTQAADQSHMHSMARQGQSAEEAQKMREQFIQEKLDAACKANSGGDRNRALDLLGEALHPLMDSDSPMHKNSKGLPAEWDPAKPWGHSPTEFIGSERVNELTPSIIDHQRFLLEAAYDWVFGR